MKNIRLSLSKLRQEGWTNRTNALIFNLLLIIPFSYALIDLIDFPPRAMVYPLVAGFFGLIASLIALFNELYSQLSVTEKNDTGVSSHRTADLKSDHSISTQQVFLKGGRFIAWILAYYLITIPVGMVLSTAIFFLLYLRIEGKLGWWANILITFLVIYFFFGIIANAFRVIWPVGLLEVLTEPLPIPWIEL